MPTFAELGFPFPLFEGAVDDAADYIEQGECSLCGAASAMCFELGIGSDVVVQCSGCDRETALDADDREDSVCAACETTVRFPADREKDVLCCLQCLRSGRAAITKDTTLGLVSWDHAASGVTHGAPGLSHPGLEMVPRDSGWVGARVDRTWLFELLRTPTYSTIQGERWEFCCQRPMVFVGAWSREMFTARAPDGNGRAFLAELLGDDVNGLWEDQLHDVTGIYVFRCDGCERLRAHWDIA